jgi:hypothetical protein
MIIPVVNSALKERGAGFEGNAAKDCRWIDLPSQSATVK